MVSYEGRSVQPTAAKQRTLLALLVLHAGQLVLTDSIVDELWGNDPCLSAATTVRTYICQIRKLLGHLLSDPRRDPQEILQAVPGGYRLKMPDAASDADRYERSVAAGREALASGDYAVAGTRFETALGLWRGPALMDVRMGTRLQAAAQRLEDSRLIVLEHRLDADLQLGRHRELLGELSGLCVDHPLHEGLHAQYMLALYRSDRRSEALAVFQRLRTAMVEDLGLEPSTRVQNLQQDILRSGNNGPAPELTALLRAQSRTIVELTLRIAEIEDRLGLDSPRVPGSPSPQSGPRESRHSYAR
ncbi:AfsR/SARP family transcriptional regulator [Streptomyces sp. NPDC005134]|uniref:AfsR/SARP family transcriptional regulator n=1 Tax=unclassified Streptomyces TaxID=2593676 RepID=UPI00224E28AE|nr:AfsR/SARP family transcriptional regulator [Streptomyces sp. NBC_00154]MCX5310561.1 AfsR/SARP family transcriptional regulator [Streptomyces sp. NBC_00154]